MPAASACTTDRRRAPMRRAGRSRAGIVVPSLRLVLLDQAVADSRLRDQTRPGGVVAELLAELAGVDAEVLRLGAVVGAPHLLEDRAMGQHPAGPPGQEGEEGELLRR